MQGGYMLMLHRLRLNTTHSWDNVLFGNTMIGGGRAGFDLRVMLLKEQSQSSLDSRGGLAFLHLLGGVLALATWAALVLAMSRACSTVMVGNVPRRSHFLAAALPFPAR